MFWFSAQLTWTEIQLFSLAALLDFTNFFRLNGSNYDHEMSHFAGVVMLKIKPKNVTLKPGYSVEQCPVHSNEKLTEQTSGLAPG